MYSEETRAPLVTASNTNDDMSNSPISSCLHARWWYMVNNRFTLRSFAVTVRSISIWVVGMIQRRKRSWSGGKHETG